MNERKRYYVTIKDTDGAIWLNTGSFHVHDFFFFRFRAMIQAVIDVWRIE
jgi:hypothetical protein